MDDDCVACKIENCIECNDDVTGCNACKIGYGVDNDECVACMVNCSTCEDSNYGMSCVNCTPDYFRVKEDGVYIC